jgi:hypothetical protein
MTRMIAQTTEAPGPPGRPWTAPPRRLTTTLYDVLTALQEEVGPDDDALVVATVAHFLRSGRLTWRAQAGGHRDQARSLTTPGSCSQQGGSPIWSPCIHCSSVSPPCWG